MVFVDPVILEHAVFQRAPVLVLQQMDFTSSRWMKILFHLRFVGFG